MPHMNDVNWPSPGRYMLAVSGGADSMALLDLFARSGRNYELEVAHVDHGLRPDSPADVQFVTEVADHRYGLVCHVLQAKLKPGASEATARQIRYRLLAQAVKEAGAAGVITAHHRDDLLETSLLNLARGTGRRGLAPLKFQTELEGLKVFRPLLEVSRATLREYAGQREISWHEDSTNADTSNPRNYVRHVLLPTARPQWRQSYLETVTKLRQLNADIDADIEDLLSPYANSKVFRLPRRVMRDLSLTETAELLVAAVHRFEPSLELNRRLVEELALFMHNGSPGRLRPISSGLDLRVFGDFIEITSKNASQIISDSV